LRRKLALLCCVVVFSVVLCGASYPDSEKIVPFSFCMDFKNDGTYQHSDTVNFHLSEAIPSQSIVYEAVNGDMVFSFEEMQNSSIIFAVTVQEKDGPKTYRGGLRGNAAVKVQLEPNSTLQFEYSLGLAEDPHSLSRDDTLVDSASGDLYIYTMKS